jgi:hypothetical protein
MNLDTILKQKFPDKKYIRYDVYQDDKRKTIHLSGFIVALKSKGLGTEFMRTLTDLADQIGYKIILTPSNAYGGDVERLKTFYQRFGFVFNKGDNKDFTHREDMHRLPNTHTNLYELFNLSINLNHLTESYNTPLNENFIQDATKWVGDKANQVISTVTDVRDIGAMFIKVISDPKQIDIFINLFKQNSLTQLITDLKTLLTKLKLGVLIEKIDDIVNKIIGSSDKVKKMFLMVGIGAIMYKIKQLGEKINITSLSDFFGDNLMQNISSKMVTMSTFFDWVSPIIGGVSILYKVLKPTLDYMQNYSKNFNLNKGAVAQVKEEDSATGNPTAKGKVWNSGVNRGKANPISNHGEWESGVTRGPANPVKTMGESLDKELNEIKKWFGKLD